MAEVPPARVPDELESRMAEFMFNTSGKPLMIVDDLILPRVVVTGLVVRELRPHH